MQQRHVIALKKAVQRLRECSAFPLVNKIYLYGSCARGEERFNSDVDLLLCMKQGTTAQEYRKLKHAAQEEDYNLPDVNVEFAGEGAFSSSRQFDENIRKDGILLWERK